MRNAVLAGRHRRCAGVGVGGRIPGASVDCYNDSTNHSALSERAARFALPRRVRDSAAGGLATARRRRNIAICRRRVAGFGRAVFDVLQDSENDSGRRGVLFAWRTYIHRFGKPLTFARGKFRMIFCGWLRRGRSGRRQVGWNGSVRRGAGFCSTGIRPRFGR